MGKKYDYYHFFCVFLIICSIVSTIVSIMTAVQCYAEITGVPVISHSLYFHAHPTSLAIWCGLLLIFYLIWGTRWDKDVFYSFWTLLLGVPMALKYIIRWYINQPSIIEYFPFPFSMIMHAPSNVTNWHFPSFFPLKVIISLFPQVIALVISFPFYRIYNYAFQKKQISVLKDKKRKWKKEGYDVSELEELLK